LIDLGDAGSAFFVLPNLASFHYRPRERAVPNRPDLGQPDSGYNRVCGHLNAAPLIITNSESRCEHMPVASWPGQLWP